MHNQAFAAFSPGHPTEWAGYSDASRPDAWARFRWFGDQGEWGAFVIERPAMDLGTPPDVKWVDVQMWDTARQDIRNTVCCGTPEQVLLAVDQFMAGTIAMRSLMEGKVTAGRLSYGPDDDIPAGFYRIIGDMGDWADPKRAPFMAVDVYADGTRRANLLEGADYNDSEWEYACGGIRLSFWFQKTGWLLAPDRDRRPEFEKLMPDGVYRPELLDVE